MRAIRVISLTAVIPVLPWLGASASAAAAPADSARSKAAIVLITFDGKKQTSVYSLQSPTPQAQQAAQAQLRKGTAKVRRNPEPGEFQSLLNQLESATRKAKASAPKPVAVTAPEQQFVESGISRAYLPDGLIDLLSEPVSLTIYVNSRHRVLSEKLGTYYAGPVADLNPAPNPQLKARLTQPYLTKLRPLSAMRSNTTGKLVFRDAPSDRAFLATDSAPLETVKGFGLSQSVSEIRGLEDPREGIAPGTPGPTAWLWLAGGLLAVFAVLRVVLRRASRARFNRLD